MKNDFRKFSITYHNFLILKWIYLFYTTSICIYWLQQIYIKLITVSRKMLSKQRLCSWFSWFFCQYSITCRTSVNSIFARFYEEWNNAATKKTTREKDYNTHEPCIPIGLILYQSVYSVLTPSTFHMFWIFVNNGDCINRNCSWLNNYRRGWP